MKKINHQRKGLNVHLISILVIATAIASPWFDLSVSNHSFVKTYVAGIGAGILVLITLWLKRNETDIKFHISWIKTGLLALFVFGTLSIFWSLNPGFTVTKWMIWFTILCSFVAGYHFKLDDESLIKLSWGLLLATFVVAGIGILQYLFDPFTLTQAASPSSTFGNKNMTTQPIVLIWPLGLFLLFSNQIKGKQVWIVSTLIALFMVFVFYTKTRSGWVSIISESIFIGGFLLLKHKELAGWISWDSNKTKASLFALGLFLILSNFNAQGWGSFVDEATARLGSVADYVSEGNARFKIWAVAIEMIKASPLFGTGLGTWFHNEVQEGFGTWAVNSYQRAHNDTLELGVEVGLVGLLLFFISVVALVVGNLKIINQDKKVPALFFFFVFVALIGSFIQMQLSFPYQLAMPAVLFGLYAGFIAKRSEIFIQPLKLIKVKNSNIYQQSLIGFWLVLMIVVSGIYIDWINTYSSLNKINEKHQFNRIEKVIPTIYHLELQNILGFLSQAYFKNGRHDIVITVEENILDHWPNANNSLYRYSYALIQKKRISDALKVAKHLKKVANFGNYKGHILELQIYQVTQQLDKYRKAFNELINIDEKLLALSKSTYHFLVNFSLYKPEFSKYTLDFYNKYNKYHPYSCRVENAMAIFFGKQKKYKEAKHHVDIIQNSKDSSCLKPSLINELKKQGF